MIAAEHGIRIAPAQVSGSHRMVAECRDRLDRMYAMMQRRRWQEAARMAGEYTACVAELKHCHDLPLDELLRLELMHRRALRWLSGQVQSMGHDLECLEEGGRRLQQKREFLERAYA